MHLSIPSILTCIFPSLLTSTEMSHDRSHYVFFWDHVVSPSNPYSEAVFSQWYPLAFHELEPHTDRVYKTAEHYMMYQKAILFDPSRAEDVLHASTPAEAQAIGRELRGFDKKRWDEVNDGIVERANYLKFTQDGDGSALDTVIDTKGKEMVEASPKDRIWGIGYGKEDAWEHRDEWGANRRVLVVISVFTSTLFLAIQEAAVTA